MSIRYIVVAALSVALVSSSFATYTARLYFKDETTAVSSAGALNVSAGDLISLNYSFHDVSPDITSRWTTLQCGISLDPNSVNPDTGTKDPGDTNPNSILTDADANTWTTQLGAAFTGTTFPIKVFWQASDGEIRDNGVDPSDILSTPIAKKGVYTLIGVNGSSATAHNYDVTFFKFHVGSAATGTLHWLLEHRATDNGITTRIYDNKNTNVKIADNWLVAAVPEPSTYAAFGMGLISLLALRRRK